jgi:hypothetical protein
MAANAAAEIATVGVPSIATVALKRSPADCAPAVIFNPKQGIASSFFDHSSIRLFVIVDAGWIDPEIRKVAVDVVGEENCAGNGRKLLGTELGALVGGERLAAQRLPSPFVRRSGGIDALVFLKLPDSRLGLFAENTIDYADIESQRRQRKLQRRYGWSSVTLLQKWSFHLILLQSIGRVAQLGHVQVQRTRGLARRRSEENRRGTVIDTTALHHEQRRHLLCLEIGKPQFFQIRAAGVDEIKSGIGKLWKSAEIAHFVRSLKFHPTFG